MAEKLVWTGSLDDYVVIVEGEIDALSLASVGVPNVVSLPDGAGSSRTVNFQPIHKFHVWFVATDEDEQGNEAFLAIQERMSSSAVRCIRVHWQTVVDGDPLVYKDANEALQAGFDRAEFLHCLSVEYEKKYMRPLGGLLRAG
jgi:DNA primase